MKQYRKYKKLALGATVLMAGGTVFQNTCINTLASLPICGAVLTFCSPSDQLIALFPLLTTPDFDADPGCTIPGTCGDGGSYEGPDDFFPGGGTPDEPEDEQGGGFQGGGGGGGI